MTSLQLGLIAAGILLVLGVLLYNWMQDRRVRRRNKATRMSSTGAGVRIDWTPAPVIVYPQL